MSNYKHEQLDGHESKLKLALYCTRWFGKSVLLGNWIEYVSRPLLPFLDFDKVSIPSKLIVSLKKYPPGCTLYKMGSAFILHTTKSGAVAMCVEESFQ